MNASRSLRLALACSTLSFGAMAAAQAHKAAPPEAPADEIIVTAQKRSERLSDVPLSITAASGEQLDRQNIKTASDLTKITPGLSFVQTAYGLPVFYIRGIGFFDNSTGASPTVTIYQDQVPLPFLLMTSGVALDPERVEVLKGPQGTLFGTNSTGGAVNFIAAKPTDHFAAQGKITYGRFNEINTEGYLSGPLADTLSARVAFRTESRGNYIRAIRPGIAAVNDRNNRAGQRNFQTGRVVLDYHPSDRMKFVLTASGWRDRSDTMPYQYLVTALNTTNGFQDPAIAAAAYTRTPDNARLADWTSGFDLERNDHFYQLSLRGDIELSDQLTLSTITAYSKLKVFIPTDSGGVNFPDITTEVDGRDTSLYQEIRLAADVGDRIKAMVGANFSYDKPFDDQYVISRSSNDGVPGLYRFYDFTIVNHQKIKTYAGFGSIDYKLLDQLTLQASARYTQRYNDHFGCLQDPGNPVLPADSRPIAGFINLISGGTAAKPGQCVSLNSNLVPGGVSDELDENNLSWRFSLNYKPNDGALLYANVTRGFKAGAFSSLAAPFAAGLRPVPQEEVLAYEAGFKARLLDRRVDIAGAVFYNDYKNKQLTGFVNIGPPFGNVPGLISVDGKIAGAEIQVTARPVSGLAITAGGTYLDTKGEGDTLVSDPYSTFSIVDGQRFPRIPKWQLLGDVEYRWPIGSNGLHAYVGGNILYQSRTYAAFGDFSTPLNQLFIVPGYALIDLRAGIETDQWSVQMFGRNVTNKFYTTDVNHLDDYVSRQAGMPVTYGVTLGYKF